MQTEERPVSRQEAIERYYRRKAARELFDDYSLSKPLGAYPERKTTSMTPVLFGSLLVILLGTAMAVAFYLTG